MGFFNLWVGIDDAISQLMQKQNFELMGWIDDVFSSYIEIYKHLLNLFFRNQHFFELMGWF